ncbi:MAG: hypothetical protein LBM64_09180, partial [Deltaproteobacteria bacterium]|nr:hypothetical protein [Deltaproteobacteria bacterium]
GTAAIADSTKVEVIVEGESPLQAGDSVTLIQAQTLSGSRAATTSGWKGMQSISLEYQFDITADLPNNRLLATLSGGPVVNPQLKAIAEGILAGPALLNQSADLLASARLRQLTGYGIFGILSGGRLRYDTGSHLDMRSLSLLTGVSAGADLAPGRLTLGAFFEYGTGLYDTYNSFSNTTSVHSDGNVQHTGGGVLGRMDFSGAARPRPTCWRNCGRGASGRI